MEVNFEDKFCFENFRIHKEHYDFWFHSSPISCIVLYSILQEKQLLRYLHRTNYTWAKFYIFLEFSS